MKPRGGLGKVGNGRVGPGGSGGGWEATSEAKCWWTALEGLACLEQLRATLEQ